MEIDINKARYKEYIAQIVKGQRTYVSNIDRLILKKQYLKAIIRKNKK